jgi:release factor glutamine methyltransferase
VPDALRAVLAQLAARLAAAPRLEPDVRADAAREAHLLVAGVLDCSPGELTQRLRQGPPLTTSDLDGVERAARRREQGEPLAYAVGTAAFRDLVLMVDRRVLIPRPETEIVVGVALELTADRPGGIAVDIGTGSGAIALSLATEGRFDRVVATDLSVDALEVAQGNAERAGVAGRVEFRAGSDLAPLADLKPPAAQARVIVSNPPYIAFEEAAALPGSVRGWEPSVALFAERGGMARYDALIAGASAVLEPLGWLVLEVDARRGPATADLAVTHGYQQVRLVQDLAGRDRVLVARRSS